MDDLAGDPSEPPPTLADFVGEPTRDLSRWRWLWDGDHRFPVRTHRGGGAAWLLVLFKRLFRPLVQVPQNDLWERQRIFNLILLEHLPKLSYRISENLDELREMRDRAAEVRDTIDVVRENVELVRISADRARRAEAIVQSALDELMRHNDALFSRVDAKVDAYRHDARDLLATLQAALARAESGASAPSALPAPPAAQTAVGAGASASAGGGTAVLSRAAGELAYVEFERRFRGTETDIAERLAVYLPYLSGGGPLLDLGCGRGEALRVFAEAGLETRGVDSSAEMVAICREAGLVADEGDLLAALAAAPAASLGAIVSFHVIEHLAPEDVARLVALAAGALRPGGVLILETPNPLSVVVAARNFWVDPTHRRPVHPRSLREMARQRGFDPIEVLDLRPFPESERLPEIPLAEISEELKPLADRVNRLRDRLDDVLFGFQDYGLVARKP